MSHLGKSNLSMYKALILPLRQADEATGGLLLKRFLDATAGPDDAQFGPQQVFERTEDDIQSLLEQFNPATVRSDLLEHLKAIVGFTSELRNITDRLSEQQLRRLITLAVPLWNERETELGIVNSIRLLTGRTAHLTNWFGFRYIIEEILLGDNAWTIGGSVSEYDEWWTNVRIMDDGALDELLLLDVLRLQRAMGERFEVVLVDFLDKFDLGLSLWTVTAGSTEPTIVDSEMIIPQGTEVQPAIPILPNNADHVNYTFSCKFRLDPGGELIAKFYVDSAGPHYYMVHILDNAPPADRLQLWRVVAGAPTQIAATQMLPIGELANVDYRLRVQVVNSGSARLIRVYIDDILLIPTSGEGDHSDTPGANPVAGPWRLLAENGDVAVDDTESFRFIPTSRYGTIQLSSLLERGGSTIVTENFIQPYNASPLAGFNTALSGLQLTCTDTSVDDLGIVSWLWNFGDGNTSTLQNPVHNYDILGAYKLVTLQVTDAGGKQHDASKYISPPVTFDGPSDWIFPLNAQDFLDVGEPALDFLWPAQDASGNMVATLGSVNLATNGAGHLYQQDISEFDRNAVENPTDAAVCAWRALTGSGPNPGAQSVAWVLAMRFPAIPAASRTIFSLTNEAGTHLRLQLLNATGRLRIQINTVDSDSVSSYTDGAVNYIVVRYDRTASIVEVLTQKERWSGTFASINDGTKGLGSVSGGTTGRYQCLYAGAAQGANAERDWKRYLQRMNVAVPY